MHTLHRALAVCGCGHDGRLGIGPHAPSAMNEVVLVEDFLPRPGDAAGTGTLLDVACGAYHTLALTSSGLYGWGLHEDGQLGLGRPTQGGGCSDGGAAATGAVVPVHVDRPLHISLHDVIGEGETDADAARVIAVYCGADHSCVRTTAGVYVTGRNDCGQLGLGHTDTVYTWTRLCVVPHPARERWRGSEAGAMATSTAASLLPSPSSSSCGPQRSSGHAQLLRGRLTHISCGSHHTLLAWSDAVVRRETERQLQSADGSEAGELVFYPSVLMACGRGDFGELGYDGDAWAVLQAKAQRQERALRTALQQQQRQQRQQQQQQQQQQGCDNATVVELGSDDGAYKFKWKAAASAKQRRAAFNSAFFGVVAVEQLEEDATVFTVADFALNESAPDEAMRRGCQTLGWWAEAATQQCPAEDVAAAHLSPESPSSETPSAAHVVGRRVWEVEKLWAMHHHSAVALRRRQRCGGAAAGEEAEAPSTVLHWGCYYCSEVEDAAASHPRAAIPDERRVSGGGVHAGEERLLRYSAGDALAVGSGASLQIMGTGNLGLGHEDSLSRTWADLACTVGGTSAPASVSVQSVTGRTHFLIRAHVTADVCSPRDADPPTCVFGFGDNLHGQIGAPAAAVKHEGAEDAVVVPRPVLQSGDVLRTASAALRWMHGREEALPPRRHSAAAALSAESTTAEALYEVVAVHSAGAGARHSVFLVEVRRLPDCEPHGA